MSQFVQTCPNERYSMSNWPFKYINGVQTEESKELEALPPSKPDPYQLALEETEQQEALL